ncbi:MAG: hypothetical protein ACRDYW_12140 [Acidimicrobiales bacterium]
MTEEHPHTLDAARAAAARDELGDWVADFLASPGSDNAPLGGHLKEQSLWWIGPVRLPISRLARLAGPPGDPVLVQVDEDEWRDDVAELGERLEEGWEPPPVVVTYDDGRLHLEDGNHRVEGLRQAGEDEVWAVIGFQDPDERDRFIASAA